MKNRPLHLGSSFILSVCASVLFIFSIFLPMCPSQNEVQSIIGFRLNLHWISCLLEGGRSGKVDA